MEKKEYFKEPGFNIITKNRIRKVKPGNLVTIIEGLRQNQYYVIDYNIIPELSGENIPYVSKNDKQEISQRFLKRGPLIELNNNKMTLEQAKDSKKRILDLRKEYFDNLKIDEYELAGYGFWGIRNKVHRRFNLVSCIKGARLYAYSKLSKQESELIKILEYGLDKDKTDIGSDVVMEVPSERVSLEKYDITLRAVPINDNKQKYGIIYDFDADHTCKFRSTRITERFTTRELFQDFHIAAAYFAFVDYALHYKKNQVPLEMCPFAIPTQKTVNFYKKLVNNVIVNYRDNNNVIKRATNQAEREILLWHFVEKYGHDETFYTKEKLKNYKW